MEGKDLSEINLLWEPVRPYLMKQIQGLYGRRDGAILEIGPFSGLIFAFAQHRIGDSFTIAAFPESTLIHLAGEAKSLGLTDSVTTVYSDPSLEVISGESADLVIFRGALFFPSLFHTDFTAIYRVLKPGGLAFVGGGFGSHTPPELIAQIAERSRRLNLAIGKVSIEPDEVRKTLAEIGLGRKAEVITDGGLWVLIRK
jgi:hypothetical protein